MRRLIGLALIGFGVFCVAFAIALPNFVYPRVAKVPENPQEKIVAKGTGLTVLVPALVVKGGNGLLTDQTVISTRYVQGQVPPNGSKVPDGQAFYRQAYNAFVDNPSIDPADTLLEANIEAASFDGFTGEATNCCGDYVIEDPTDDVGESVKHRGLVFKFPFKTERKNYEWWDSTIKATATARYDGTEKINGLVTYRFIQVITDEVVGTEAVPGAMVGSDEQSVNADRIYATKRTLWVEPNTGAVVKGAEDVNQRLSYEGKSAPIIYGHLEFTPETVQNEVDEYKPLAWRLAFVTTWGPVGGWVAGPILALIGITILYFGRTESRDWDEWDDDDEDEDDEADDRSFARS
ncbi:DUF3068 domain-containing protein [Spongisporangium articulatum]|uniref:DUF3068 domain-containing protein n=1 Tax=Spongisporangium articulatum TaxID=3362603 RepID=A0ABW8ASM3_9ACTN